MRIFALARLLIGLQLTLFVLTGCKLGDYEIVLPVRNAQFVDQLPERVMIRYDSMPSRITLNGIPVQHLFTFDNGEATAAGEILQGYFRQGKNNLAVDGHLFGPRRFFHYDTEGPRVLISSTERNDDVIIEGELLDPAGAYSASINGVPVIIDEDNQFSATLAQSAVYIIETEDNYAQTATHYFAERETILDDIVKVRIDQQGINAIIPTVQEALEEQDLAALLGSIDANTLVNTNIGITTPTYSITEQINVCKEVCIDFNIFDICIDFKKVCNLVDQVTSFPSLTFNILKLQATLTTLEFEEIYVNRLDLNDSNGWEGLRLEAEMEEVDLGVAIDLDILGLGSAAEAALRFFGWYDDVSFLAGDFNISIHLNSLGLASDLGLSAQNGDIDISIVDIEEIQVNGVTSAFEFTIPLPQAVRDFGFGLGGLVSDTIENGLNAARAAIMDLVLGKVVPAIANLIIQPLINELQVRVGATVNNGAYLTALIGVENLNVVNSASELLIFLNGRIGTETTTDTSPRIDIGVNLGFPDLLGFEEDILPDVVGIPENLGPAPGIVSDSLGFYFTPARVPNPSRGNNLSVVASGNLINQAIFAIYEAGLLSPTINILDDLTGTGQYIMTTPEEADTRILFRPIMSPQLVFRGDIQSVAYLNVDHFVIIYQQLDTENEWRDVREMAVSMEIPVQLSVDGQQGLQLGLINPELELVVETRYSFDLNFSFPPKFILFKGVAALLIDQLNQGLSVVDLPNQLLLNIEESSLAIHPGSVTTVGFPRRHFAFTANLNSL